MRDCAGCTLCCRVLGVKEIDKAPLTECMHCFTTIGCAIYKNRPKECREFDCLWLVDENLPEDLKPSTSHVVLSDLSKDLKLEGLEPTEKTIIVHIDPDYPNAYKEGHMKTFLNKQLKEGTALIVVRPDQQKVFMKWGTVDDGI